MNTLNVATAHNAVLTLHNQTKHFTFKIQAPKTGANSIDHTSNLRFVKIKTSDGYKYAGIAHGEKGIKATAKSKIDTESLEFKAVAWAIRLFMNGKELPIGYEIDHNGKCMVCGRKLTDPDSIKAGIGPGCASKV